MIDNYHFNISALITSVFYFLTDDIRVVFLIFLIFVDLFLGVFKGIITDDFCIIKLFKGSVKLFIMILTLILVKISGIVAIAYGITVTQIQKFFVLSLGYFTATYSISIFYNLVKLGLKVPTSFKIKVEEIKKSLK